MTLRKVLRALSKRAQLERLLVDLTRSSDVTSVGISEDDLVGRGVNMELARDGLYGFVASVSKPGDSAKHTICASDNIYIPGGLWSIETSGPYTMGDHQVLTATAYEGAQMHLNASATWKGSTPKWDAGPLPVNVTVGLRRFRSEFGIAPQQH
ncbi:hypothetical protein RI367_005862 [Sorochytrium milnesiophthora]